MQVSSLLRDRFARLVVLTGPGGVGKTRLAIAISDELAQDFADGVTLINLETATHADQVLPIIATALNVRESASDDLFPQIKAAVQDLDTLLVLDNLEQIIDAAPLLTELLINSHRLSMLVTSRSILDVYGEYVFPVPPMSVPDVETNDKDVIGQSDAVQLFVNRVTALRPEFHLNARNAPAIARITAHLDGIPLAIELAAARTSLFTIAELDERLHQRLPILEGTARNVPDRQRTMNNAITWSYDLLSPLEQQVFRQLSVFMGPWTLESAQSLLLEHADTPIADAVSLIEAIASLIDQSLVQRIESNERDRTFRLLHIVRKFAQHALAQSGERETIERQHSRHIVHLARRASPHLTGREQVYWLDQLDHHAADIIAVFERLMASGQPHDALELMTLTWRHGYVRSNVLQSRQFLLRALDATRGQDTDVRGNALNAAGVLSNMLGDYERMHLFHSEALELGRQHNDLLIMATALFGLGDHAAFIDNPEDAEDSFLEAERLYTELDHPRGIATAQTNLGNLYWSMGKLDEARKINEAALRLYETVGDQRGLAWSYTNVGRLSAELSQPAHAAASLVRAMDLYELLADRNGIAEALEGFALIAVGVHEHERAAQLLGAAERIRTEIAHPVPKQDQVTLDRIIAMATNTLGKDAFERARMAGHSMTDDDAVRNAVEIQVPQDADPQVDVNAPAIVNLGVTDRELQVLQKLGSGDTDKEIAERLYISPRTVQSHVQNLLNKLDVTSRSAAVAKAFRIGLLR